MLELRDVTVRFGGVVPLDGVTLDFRSGVCGLVGPNGAGKTTLLNVLNGFTDPASGSVVAEGDDLLAMPAHRRARWGLRRTFQLERIVPQLTARENVELTLEHVRAANGLTADAALELVGLDGVADERSERLSTLQRRLLEIARAVAGTPRIVLLDEPGAGSDERETEVLAGLITAAHERTGALIILVDHDMELVRAVCANVAVLDFGRLIATGKTDDVLEDPKVREAYFGAGVL
jgi:ABC-type branched-subunit amino acid transport system ATPase component